MRESFILKSELFPDIELQTSNESDCENLRNWKNANRFSFFYQEIITPEQQRDWFEAYLAREGDYMFIVTYQNRPVGCMGFRMIDREADIYNVILGCREKANQGLMSKAFKLMLSFVYSSFTHAIRLKVLSSNPAVEWYLNRGFRLSGDHENFFSLSLFEFQPCQVEKVDRGPRLS